ncbi:GldG family protein [Desulfohalobiaceae bacterium Ax17]|uniref:GldG family protein n=1 Tax=Desulfovulcanus ferrireducens TaxID=2831190 RepID=UPI00207BC376|nr:GldG family protein [Desulfovulcanus ferrireducens]MBT8763828.1 GldG family protein [Desulfovulcanus ferrireducens]
MTWKKFGQLSGTIIVGLAVLVGLNVLANKADLQYDTTKNKRYSLSKQTVKVLKHLERPVKVLCFYRPGEAERKNLEDLLKLYAKESANFSFEFVDPDRSPFRAKEFKVRQTGEVILLSENRQEKILFPDEEKLTNGLIRVSNPEKAKFYFVQGHGEVPFSGFGEKSITQLKDVLKNQGVELEKLLLAREKKVPEDASALVIIGPQKDFLKHELALLTDYLNTGGRLFLALNAETETNLDLWIKDNLHLKRLSGLILDPMSKLIVGDYLSPLVQDYPYHKITEDFNLMTIFPTCTAFEEEAEAQAKYQIIPLGRSTGSAWLETDLVSLKKGQARFDPGKDIQGPLWLAVVYENEFQEKDSNATLKSRVVVFGDNDFLTNQFIGLSGNMDLARNSLNWLREKEDTLAISKPKLANSLLFLNVWQQRLITWVPLVVLPLLCVLMAVYVGMKRRKC